ncbi:hypothetical protein [Arthrobacter sp. UYCo732]|uniref:hypothetical protein n=1 Tax=Arthrobacter sp. UYCo732 TaxID=3156336 RepID=UPI003395BC73
MTNELLREYKLTVGQLSKDHVGRYFCIIEKGKVSPVLKLESMTPSSTVDDWSKAGAGVRVGFGDSASNRDALRKWTCSMIGTCLFGFRSLSCRRQCPHPSRTAGSNNKQQNTPASMMSAGVFCCQG